MEPCLSDLTNDMCFVKITKISDFLKHKPQNYRVYVCFYILIYTPKRATYPLRYKHLETDYKKCKHLIHKISM